MGENPKAKKEKGKEKDQGTRTLVTVDVCRHTGQGY